MTTANEAGPVVIDHVIGDRGQLTIHLVSAEIRLAAVGGARVIVRTPAGRSLPDRVSLEPTDRGLRIRERDSHGIRVGRQRMVQLEIDLPAMAEVSVHTAAGWLDAVGLTGEQRYRTVAGETRLRGGAGQIELNTVSGDATIELEGGTDLAIKSVSGDAIVRGGTLDALRIGTTSGDIRVDSPIVGRSGNKIETLSGDVEVVATAGMTVEARTVSGDLVSDLPHRNEGRMGRRTLTVGDGSVELAFRSVSGDLRIRGRGGRPDSHIPPLPPLVKVSPISPFSPFSDDDDAGSDGPGFDLPGFDLPALDLSGLTAGFGGAPRPARPAAPATSGAAPEMASDPDDAERMAILRALEAGDLDVPTAMARLGALDAAARGRDDGDV